MPVRFLSDAELARLSNWPGEIADDDLVTYFTLSSADLDWLVANARFENRLGAAVQLCALPWLGWIPDELSACPPAAVRRLADQLRLADEDVPGLLSAYGGWEGRTRRDHRALVLDRLGWRASAAGDRKQLDAFLLSRALEHDAPGVLLQLACDWLRSERIVRPTVDTLWLYGMAEFGYAIDDEVPGIMADATARGCDVRVLLLDPDYVGATDLDVEEGNPPGTLGPRIRASLRRFHQMRENCGPSMKIRVYGAHPTVSIVRGDDQMLLTPYVRFFIGSNSPTLEFRAGPTRQMFDRYARHVEHVWQLARDWTP
jgi:hypothetical protein